MYTLKWSMFITLDLGLKKLNHYRFLICTLADIKYKKIKKKSSLSVNNIIKTFKFDSSLIAMFTLLFFTSISSINPRWKPQIETLDQLKHRVLSMVLPPYCTKKPSLFARFSVENCAPSL